MRNNAQVCICISDLHTLIAIEESLRFTVATVIEDDYLGL